MRAFFAVLLLGASLGATACPLCLGAFRASMADQLVDARQVVLADPGPDRRTYRVVAVIKGERPASAVIEASAVRTAEGPTDGAKATALLVRDEGFAGWQSIGTVTSAHAAWLRKLAAGKRAAEMNADDWRARVAVVLPYLEHREPLLAKIAFGELASAPYGALLTLRPSLSAATLRSWLADPALAPRESLYVLLLGIAGNAGDAAVLERRLEAAYASGDTTSLGSLIAADLQLRGAARVAWVEQRYLVDGKRSSAEIGAALAALSVHGNAGGTIPRERVIAAYRLFMRAHPDIAGHVARDLAAWRYWDAVPEYVAIMKSGTRQQYPSWIAIATYLRESPDAGAIDLPLPDPGRLPGEAASLPRRS
ncbi:MAG: hypothetical protein U1F41_14060 [Burkholderiales bacterium]